MDEAVGVVVFYRTTDGMLRADAHQVVEMAGALNAAILHRLTDLFLGPLWDTEIVKIEVRGGQ